MPKTLGAHSNHALHDWFQLRALHDLQILGAVPALPQTRTSRISNKFNCIVIKHIYIYIIIRIYKYTYNYI